MGKENIRNLVLGYNFENLFVYKRILREDTLVKPL